MGLRKMEERIEGEVKFGAPLKRGEFDPYRWRSTMPGMWAWLWQRISALVIIVLLALHITLTYRPLIQFLLLLVVTFHATLGLRVIILDLGLAHIRYQKALFAGLMAVGLTVFVIVWVGIY